jgi:hypothetical protein
VDPGRLGEVVHAGSQTLSGVLIVWINTFTPTEGLEPESTVLAKI